MDQINILIIGGGVVGCAIAAELSAHWPDVFVVERLPRVGMATSSRNSGVIHSGIYYLLGSLKARHCLEGNRVTFAFCEKHKVAHRRTGTCEMPCFPVFSCLGWCCKPPPFEGKSI